MKIEKVHAVYFSPTGTTKTVITHLVYHYVITGSRDGSERLYVAVGAEESA